MKYLDFNLLSGVSMPRYLTQHTLACLTRQGAEALAQRMQAGGLAHAERVLVNMLEGKMFVEFRADSSESSGRCAATNFRSPIKPGALQAVESYGVREKG
jgi:hypothetical protein